MAFRILQQIRERLNQQLAFAIEGDVVLNFGPKSAPFVAESRNVALHQFRQQSAQIDKLEEATSFAAFNLRDSEDCSKQRQDLVNLMNSVRDHGRAVGVIEIPSLQPVSETGERR